jgi:hypothetical protein
MRHVVPAPLPSRADGIQDIRKYRNLVEITLGARGISNKAQVIARVSEASLRGMAAGIIHFLDGIVIARAEVLRMFRFALSQAELITDMRFREVADILHTIDNAVCAVKTLDH